MLLQGNFEIDAPRARVWKQITDPGLMAVCIPGCEAIEQFDEVTYRAVVVVGVGVVKARFNLLVEVIEENSPSEVRSRTSGIEGGRASTLNAENRVWLTEVDSGKTRVDYESDVNIAGRLGKFGMGVMRKHIEKMGDAFAANFALGIVEGKGAVERHVEAAEGKTARPGLLQRLHLAKAPDTGAREPAPPENSEPAGPAQPSAPARGMLLFPSTTTEAVDMLVSEAGSHPLAGGATLIAMKNAGLVDVKRYVSLERIEELRGITELDDGSIRIGAMTRHRETAVSEFLQGPYRVLRDAAASIANMPVRNMGTMGGSLAHADPAADYLAALTCIDARVVIAGPKGERSMDISELIVGWYETGLDQGEIITSILLPPRTPGYSSYRKVARVSGDFAVATCALSVAAGGQGPIRIAIGGCGPAPVRLRDAELGSGAGTFTGEDVDTFSAALAARADPVDDVRGSADYRRSLIPRLVADAIAGFQQAEVS